MRVSRAGALLAAWMAASTSALQGQGRDAAQVLTAARDALGGETRLASVKTFIATGRTRQIRGNNLVPIEFEITCELPDKFVRKDEIPAQDTDLIVTGFRGDQLIQFPPPRPGTAGLPGPPAGRGANDGSPGSGRGGSLAGRGGGPPLNPAQQRLTTMKQDFARLMLGVFATSFPTYPLTFAYAAEGEAPEGKADILDVAGPANFAVRLVVQRDTRLPVMLMWQMPPSAVIVRLPGQPAPDSLPPGAVVIDAPAPPVQTASQAERDAYAATVATLRRQALAEAKPIDHRLYYADYRTVNGIKWPFRIRRAIAGTTIEETTFDRVSINVHIDPRKFQAPK